MKNEHFKVGKYYKHSGGRMIHIISAGKTTLYGWCLIAEEKGYSNLLTIGQDKESTVNWEESTEEEWMKGFS